MCGYGVRLLALTLLALVAVSQAQDDAVGGNVTEEAVPWWEAPKCKAIVRCKPGVILPMWEPQVNISTGDKAARAIVYFFSMVFMFLGVSIIADRFMAAIEVITSKEREVTIKKPNGETAVVTVRVWNETVSNLTLMALGSSAPEILLSVIEVAGNKFEAGDLGPSTIVGSAAFNLFIIIAICVYVIPEGEVRRIKHLGVFFVTATWSIFAYFWMYIIISVITPSQIDIWEGLLTFIYFPITVGTAYIADRKIFFWAFLGKKYTGTGKTVSGDGDMEMQGDPNDVTFKGLDDADAEVREFERHRKDFIEIMRELRKKHPNIDMKELEEMAELEAMNRGPKSRAFYRIQATRKLTGGGNVIKKSKLKGKDDEVVVEKVDDHITRVFFEPAHYTVMENVGTMEVTVSRQGGNQANTLYVDYRTEDGTANAGTDYDFAEGTLVFHPGESHKQFGVNVLDDDVFEEDEHFYVRLTNCRVGNADGLFSDEEAAKRAILANPSMCTVMILDDDHAGIYHFEQKDSSFPENCGEAEIKVARSSGARGTVRVPYKTSPGTARGGGVDFEDQDGYLIFDNNCTEAFIKIRLVDDEEYEKNEVFYIELGEPTLYKRGSDGENEDGTVGCFGADEGKKDELPDDVIAQLGKPVLGEITKIECHIRESMEFKSTVDKLIHGGKLSVVVGTSSWREQFVEAITVSADDGDGGEGGDEDEDGEDGEGNESLPSCMDYVMHFLCIFWKLLFAFVPPTDYCGGWACFMISLGFIAIQTAFIGDIASSFGCMIGLNDAVNAISFVALGTSLPDTFASKVAATGDPYADSSVGNVTGSNAVNVFLGIGIAWTMAAIYQAVNPLNPSGIFVVDPGSLAYSVTIFCVLATVAVFILIFRRKPSIGGELGGPMTQRYITSTVLIIFWLIYIIMSSLESYCHIPGF